MNRIRAAWHDATDWGTEYSADIWGNLYQKSACDNVVCPTRSASDTFSATANTNNQFAGYSYDASGNLQNDQLGHTFSYDGQNRPYSAGGVTYYYDGEGERVAKSSGKLYWFGSSSAPVLETDVNGNTPAEYVFFNGKRMAMRDSAGAVHYYFADQIGSANVVTDAVGTMPPEQDIEYHPYGEQQVYRDTLAQQYRFTGHEHDTETNNDYFGARYYSSTSGRFLTPDWAATPVPVPYTVLGNPQTLNLYSYVENNPITGTDPDGHDSADNPLIGDAEGTYDCNIRGSCGGQNNIQKSQPPPPPQPVGNVPAPTAGTNSPAQNTAADKPAPQPAPTDPKGNPTAPPVPVPGAPEGTGWKWNPDPQNPRGGTWGPDGWKGPNPPRGSWDPDGHWDIDKGDKSPRDHYDPKGNPITPGTAHPGNAPTTMMDRMRSITPGPILKWGTTGVVLYIIIDEGSRLYPPRNLVPVP